MTFHARLATKAEKTIATALVAFDEADRMAGDLEVGVAIDCSTVNDKDALAMRGRAGDPAFPAEQGRRADPVSG